MQGLSFNAFDGDIRDLFNACGKILNVKMMNRPDGKPKVLPLLNSQLSQPSTRLSSLMVQSTWAEISGSKRREEQGKSKNREEAIKASIINQQATPTSKLPLCLLVDCPITRLWTPLNNSSHLLGRFNLLESLLTNKQAR